MISKLIPSEATHISLDLFDKPPLLVTFENAFTQKTGPSYSPDGPMLEFEVLGDRNNSIAYDCESMPLYENQEGCIRDYAEREAYWDLPTAMSPESFVRGAVSTPEQSTSYSDARVSSSAETIDLVTSDLLQGTPPNAACYAPKKRKLQLRGF